MSNSISLRWKKFGVLGLGMGLLGTARLSAVSVSQAEVTWSSAATISGNGDVLTTGARVYAVNIGSSSISPATVNGVTFDALVFPDLEAASQSLTVGSITFTESPDYLSPALDLHSAANPFASLSADYRALLSSGGTTHGITFETLTLTLGGLVSGHSYLFQWWTNMSTGSYSRTIASDSFEHELQLAGGLGPDGYLGQFGVGAFTATGLTQDFFFTGNDSAPLINAFQLRDLTAVPEPSTTATIAAGVAFALALFRRRARPTKA